MWKTTVMKYVYRFVPVSRWCHILTPEIILSDGIAGFIVGVMIVPTCLSWSSLAGLPFSCGLIAALVASFSYGTFGQCASLSIGPVAEITTLLISIPGIPAAERQDTFQSLGLQVGILSMALSFVDCGTVIKTIFAKAVGDGYTCAAALLAISAQLKVIFNVVPEDKGCGNLINTLIALGSQGSSKSFYCFVIFMVYCTYLIQIKKARRLPLWIPHQLIVVVVSILLTWGFRLDQKLDLAIVRDIPAILSWPRFPPMDNLIGLGPYTLAITVISFVQMYVVAQRVMPNVDPNTELFAGGITNLLVNVMSGMPVSNSFSCSSVLIEQHVITPLTAYATGGVVLITILFLTRIGVFYYLPKQALAAIIISSVWRLVNFSGPVQLWRYSRKDAGVWVLTFLLTVLGGITIGVLSGIAFSLILVVLRIARPRAVSVGFNVQTFHYGDIRKDPELLVYPNILMWRFDAPLYFINIGYFKERLMAAIAAEVRPIDVVLVTCGKVVDIDAAALASLPIILEDTSKSDPTRPRRIILTDIHGRLEKVLLDSAALPIYVPEEYDGISIEQIATSGKFPVVFRKLEDAIAFGQRCISERYGNVDTAPYPNVAFLTDVVMQAARLPTGDDRVPPLLSLLEAADATSTSGCGTAVAAAPRGLNASHIMVTAPSVAPPSPSQAEERRGKAARAEASVSSPHPPHTTITSSASSSEEAMNDDEDDGDGGVPPQQQQDNLVRHLATLKKLSTYSPDRQLVGVLGVIRHGEVTPKQKKKLLFNDPTLLRLAFQGRDLRRTKRSVDELAEFFVAVERLLWELPTSTVSAAGSADILDASILGTACSLPSRISKATTESWARVLSIVRSRPDGLKVQIKARVTSTSGAASFNGSGQTSPQKCLHYSSSAWRRAGSGGTGSRYSSGSGSADDDSGEPTAGLLVVKWGGVLTKSGILQAHVMGEKLFARFYAAGDLPLRRLVQFTCQPLVTASDENRVVNTALVVANALTQASGVTVRRCDIVLNDNLTKTLGSVAKRLLREEHRYFESLLHIESAAAARHFFHIPGFRQLLSIPSLDRFRGWVGSEHDDDRDDGEESNNGMPRRMSETMSHHSENREASGRSGLPPPSLRRRSERAGGRDNSRNIQIHGAQDTDFPHGSRVFSTSESPLQRPNCNVLRQEEFHTPYEVLQELKELMSILSTLEFPEYLAKAPLSNHETLQELQQRYEALLHNFEGAKRRIRSSYRRSESMRCPGASRTPMTLEAKDGRAARPAVASARLDEDPEQQLLLAAIEETGGSSDEDGLRAQLVEDTELDPSVSLRRDPSELHRTPIGARLSFPPMLASSEGGACGAQCDQGGYGHSTLPAQQRTTNGRGNAGLTRPRPLNKTFGPTYASFKDGDGHGSNGFGVSGAAPRFDVSDVSKLRDYGSYDVAYNLPLVLQLHASVQEPAVAFQLRRFACTLQRFAEITEYMSRIGENVLVGVNSSKRFIIGSLVSDGLLRRLHNDFLDLATVDEERGVQELLLKAQAQYMAENGGVEQDVRHMIGLFSRLPCWSTKKKRVRASEREGSAWRNDPWAQETPQEREFRLRVPFISLPKQEAWAHAAAADFAKCTRLYFTTYLHVEGVLQCLFESVTVEGFSRPSKEEMEATHQLYMRHLIFKIFRRRNVSYTDAEVTEAMRRLHLLFRSGVDYDKQQRELRRGLAAIYHAMYYVSMEVYLSLGDVDEAQTAIMEEFPLFSLDLTNSSEEGGNPQSATGTAASGGNGEDGEELAEAMAAAGGGSSMVAASVHRSASLLPPFAACSGTRCLSSGPASYSPAAAGGNSAEAFTGFARSPVYGQYLVPPSNTPEATAASVSDGGGSVALVVTSPASFSDAATHPAAGSGAESDSGDNGPLNPVHRRGPNLSTFALAPPPQREPKGRSRPMTAASTNTKGSVKEATVLVTPEAGRRTAVIQGMKHRVSNVTPMRRIHEGLSLNDFVLLMKEVESAVRSQTASSSSAHETSR
ncbi:putative Sulfate permease family/STAS domain/Histidine phosphatase superfamily (branch 2) [Leishmania naiffi]|uniref:Sulfate permease family/STAS domain/Histidine phosphatase superfamily (Branch 2) n=1 Tax=Leishmania naiffi TaxID=5678 RepID=A0AAW3BLG0_9TRYP